MSARGRWVAKGSVAMAALAVLSLGATVFVAQRALRDASDVVVRGETEVLMSTVVGELLQEEPPLSVTLLQRELATHDAEGLRYLAVVDRDGEPSAEAGSSQMRDQPLGPGEATRAGRRVRVLRPLLPGRGRPFGHQGMSRPPPGAHIQLLVMEFEPPLLEKLRGDLSRIAVVAAALGAGLLAFAVAWSKSAARLEAVERKVAREQRLVALGSMSSVMAHELRNPLASLKGHAQLLVEDLEDGKKKAKAERVVAEAERLEKLTTSLLDFVRDGPIERAAIPPAELIARSVQDLASERVKVDLAKAPAALVVDAGRFSRAVHNIVDNALQATADTAVDLVVTRDGDDAVIAVRDRGPGIPVGSEVQIFEPFVTTRVKGTGLGLAVARRIAEQHGGTLDAANHPDGGAIFTLRFPVQAT